MAKNEPSSVDSGFKQAISHQFQVRRHHVLDVLSVYGALFAETTQACTDCFYFHTTRITSQNTNSFCRRLLTYSKYTAASLCVVHRALCCAERCNFGLHTSKVSNLCFEKLWNPQYSSQLFAEVLLPSFVSSPISKSFLTNVETVSSGFTDRPKHFLI